MSQMPQGYQSPGQKVWTWASGIPSRVADNLRAANRRDMEERRNDPYAQRVEAMVQRLANKLGMNQQAAPPVPPTMPAPVMPPQAAPTMPNAVQPNQLYQPTPLMPNRMAVNPLGLPIYPQMQAPTQPAPTPPPMSQPNQQAYGPFQGQQPTPRPAPATPQQAAAPQGPPSPQPTGGQYGYGQLPPDYQKMTASEASWNSLPPNLQALALQHYNNQVRQSLAALDMPMPQTPTFNQPDRFAEPQLAGMVAQSQNLLTTQAAQAGGMPVQFAPDQYAQAQQAQAMGAPVQYGTPQTPGQLRDSFSQYGILTGYGLPSSGGLAFTSTMPEAVDPAARQRAIRIGLEQREAAGDRTVVPYLNSLRADEAKQAEQAAMERADQQAAQQQADRVELAQIANPPPAPPMPKPLNPEEREALLAKTERDRAAAERDRQDPELQRDLARIMADAEQARRSGDDAYAAQLDNYHNQTADYRAEIKNLEERAKRLDRLSKAKSRATQIDLIEQEYPELKDEFRNWWIIPDSDPTPEINKKLGETNKQLEALRKARPQRPVRGSAMPTPPTPSPTTQPSDPLNILG